MRKTIGWEVPVIGIAALPTGQSMVTMSPTVHPSAPALLLHEQARDGVQVAGIDGEGDNLAERRGVKGTRPGPVDRPRRRPGQRYLLSTNGFRPYSSWVDAVVGVGCWPAADGFGPFCDP